MGDYFKALNATDAHVSGDGNHLFFLSQDNGIYWMETGIIDYLKNEDLGIARRLINTMYNEDLQTAILAYRALKKKHAVYLDINEYLLNQRGHQLLDLEQFADATTLFTIIVALFPRSWNAYDSLGEAFFASGNMADAAECYERSLELNPRNENAVMMLERIRAIHHH
jgi:tetratricopeptide (TPR) repeat protein